MYTANTQAEHELPDMTKWMGKSASEERDWEREIEAEATMSQPI